MTLGSQPAGLRTDPHLFRPIEAGDPAVIAVAGVVALGGGAPAGARAPRNRIRQQLWRYYPQLLEVSDDVTAEWVLDLWTLAPTPAKAARLRKATLARLLQEHRIRRVDAEQVLGLLRQPAIPVAEGVTEAAVLHLRSLVARLRLANREFHQAERKLDELCTALKEDTIASGDAPRDAAVLSSLPGIGPSHPGDFAHRGGRADQPPRLRRPQDPLWRSARDQAQRQELHRGHALCRPGPTAQRCVPLGASGCPE